MLRETKNLHIRPRLVPFSITTSTAAPNVTIGYGDIIATRLGAGYIRVALKVPFARHGLFFGSQYTNSGGFLENNLTAGSNSTYDFVIRDSAGTSTEGTMDGLFFGWDNDSTDVVSPQNVVCTIERPRMIWGKIASAGTVAIGTSDFTVTKTATGVYSIGFRRAFGKTPIVLATPILSTVQAATLSSKTAFGVTVSIATAVPAAADGSFYILVIGSDSTSDSSDGRMPLQHSQRKLFLTGAQVTAASGGWTKSIGSTDFGAVTDVGAGNFSMNLSSITPARNGAFFVTSSQQRAQAVEDMVSGLVNVKTMNAAGVDNDLDGITHILAISSLDATEY